MITYAIKSLGSNVIYFNEPTTITAPYFLALLTDPCTAEVKSAVITPQGCENNWELDFTGVGENYEDLLNGEIYFKNLGTWEAAIYEQTGENNTDTDNATFLINILLQVQ